MKAGERGTVLVEALIASAIIAAMVGLMFKSVEGVATRAGALDDRRQAGLVAQSQLAAAGASLRGSAEGLDGGYAWRVDVRSYAGEGSNAEPGLERVSVSVGKAGRTLASLSTLRLAR